MSTPGYYKVNPRALSFAGTARTAGLFKALLAFCFRRAMRPSPVGWMPTLWSDLEATERELSPGFWEATAPERKEFEQLGFMVVAYKKAKRLLNLQYRDSGGINYLDATRSHFGQLMYTRVIAGTRVRIEKAQTTVAFTGVFEGRSLSYTNNKSPFESLPQNEVVRVVSNSVSVIYGKFLEHLKRCSQPPQMFPDDAALRHWFDQNQILMFEDRVRRGVFIRMTDSEVLMAQEKIPPPLPPKSDPA